MFLQTGSRKENNRSGARTITDLKRVSYFWVPNGWIKTSTDQNQLWIKLKEKKMCISSTYTLRKPSNGLMVALVWQVPHTRRVKEHGRKQPDSRCSSCPPAENKHGIETMWQKLTDFFTSENGWLKVDLIDMHCCYEIQIYDRVWWLPSIDSVFICLVPGEVNVKTASFAFPNTGVVRLGEIGPEGLVLITMPRKIKHTRTK